MTSTFRLLRQATWGPRPGDIDHVERSAPTRSSTNSSARPDRSIPTRCSQPIEADAGVFHGLALSGPDQLRQRVAWALHKIWVVSAVEVTNTSAIVTYYRLLSSGAFGNYRDLMRAITLNPAMGRYLNMLNNRSQAVDRRAAQRELRARADAALHARHGAARIERDAGPRRQRRAGPDLHRRGREGAGAHPDRMDVRRRGSRRRFRTGARPEN